MKDKSELHTRTRLLIAAERVFALYGVEGATSRMIVAEAKQRNQPALTYHVTTRQKTSMLTCREVSHLPAVVAGRRVKTTYQSISYLTAHLEARCAVGPWKARKAELDGEIEPMVDEFSGFMLAPHRAVAPTSIEIPERKELEMKPHAALLCGDRRLTTERCEKVY